MGKTFVAVANDGPSVLGYYTLAAGRMALEQIPPERAKKLPRHPVPVVLLGRVAVDLSQQGTGPGTRLLMNAFARVQKIATQAGVHAVEVDALDEPAALFYEKLGFTRLLDNLRHLYLPIKTIGALQLDPEDV